jgi:serine/threonine protein kinase
MQIWNPQANAIFLDALELEDSDARSAFVLFSCKNQPELEAEVRAMLASYEQSSEFLQASNVDTKESGELTSETVGPSSSKPHFQQATNAIDGTIDQGTMLDRYRIDQVLGSGGMGIVYLATDTRLNRRVAIKIPRREFHSDSDRRLEREARTMASVKHPNLASLLDVAEWNGIKYLLMEFVDGQTLDARIRDEQSMDQHTIAQWLSKLCSATACAHETGVVHRDIKPSNIILRPDGEPVLMDFGLAVSDSEDSRLTKSGAIIGTPAYMAPEQLHGAQHLVGPQSDIYALGAIGYELLTGRAIYEGSTSKVLSDLADGKPLMAPSQLRKDADRNLEAIILKAIAREPKDRFASAMLMSQALQAYLDSDVKELRELVQVSPARKKPWNGTRWIVAALCSFLVLGSIFVIQTNDGEFVLETDDPEIAARIAQSGGITVENRKAKTEYTLKIGRNQLPNGDYDLIVSSPDGLELSTSKFQIKRLDGQVAATVTARPKPVTTDTKSNSLTKSKPLAMPPFREQVPSYDEVMPELYSTLPDDLKLHPLLSPEYKWSEPENLGRAIFPQGAMRECYLTRDEMHVIFRHDMSVLIASRKTPDQPFGSAQVLSSDEYHIFPSISNDLLRLSYCAGIGGGKGGFDLWVRTRVNQDEPWSRWELDYPEIGSEDNDGQSWLSSSGLEVYFCSSRPGSLGNDDLWMAKRESTEKPFGSPIRLHENMNSVGQDFCPSLCADDRILLFCSMRNGGAGYMDIYLSIRNDREEAFTYPIRLGKEINGEFNEGRAMWSAANKTLYFESNRPGGNRSSDFWSIQRIPSDPSLSQ